MRLIIASNNAHKVREIRQIVGKYFTDMSTLRDAGLSIDVVEDGTTFQENAIKKAEEVLAAASGFDAALADDSGLIVDALNGAPGVYSARYAGEGHNDADNNRKLMEDMKNVPDELRSCRLLLRSHLHAAGVRRSASSDMRRAGSCMRPAAKTASAMIHTSFIRRSKNPSRSCLRMKRMP